MAAQGGNWDDLAVRLGSAVAMVIGGGAAIVAGGLWFMVLSAIVAGLMVWELCRMLFPMSGPFAVQMAILSAFAVMAALVLPGFYTAPILIAPSLVAVSRVSARRVVLFAYMTGVLFAGFGLAYFRDALGIVWLLWLVAVVVGTDILGYFAGRLMGGPKFWPRISPKKTWSGTVAGWIAAAVIGLVFGLTSGAGAGLAVLSVALSFASQMGDIAESAIKRRCQVKDSSRLIPGHGGVLDRFDGLLGAVLLMLVLQFIYLPVIGG